MNEQTKTIDLQIDHPEVDDLQQGFRARSLKAHVLSLIHRWPYEQLIHQASGKAVLELGCNKGFGTIIYADAAKQVKAVDTSPGAIEKASNLNARDNVDYICLHSWTLPFDDDSFDLTVLFQVIEHIALDKLDIFLREIKRVTRSDGQVIVTTPNRDIRLLPFQKPRNRFHVKEYTARELEALLRGYFPEVSVEGLFGVEALNQIERKRVKQKPLKVYIKEPIRKYLIRPILGRIKGDAQENGSRRAATEVAEPDSTRANSTTDEAVDYPFTTADLETRADSLRQSLDLRATVLRVE